MFKKLLLVSALTLPMCSYAADITMHNNTKFSGTAYIGSSPCSSWLGSRGVAKPHESLSVPTSLISTLCGSSNCTVYVYPNNNCSGKAAGKATVNAKNGVINMTVEDNRFTASGGGFNVDLNEKNPTLKSWLKSWFE